MFNPQGSAVRASGGDEGVLDGVADAIRTSEIVSAPYCCEAGDGIKLLPDLVTKVRSARGTLSERAVAANCCRNGVGLFTERSTDSDAVDFRCGAPTVAILLRQTVRRDDSAGSGCSSLTIRLIPGCRMQ